MASRKKLKPLNDNREERRLLAESDLEEFIKLVQPKRLLGNVHREVISWWTRDDAKSHQLLLLPRDHMKSALVAFWTAWEITKDPTLRVLYISSTSNLATKQLKFIKDILTSDNYSLYWPEMVHPEEAKREKWTEREISVDDPRRRDESVRDPTVFTAGLTTNIVGLHCDVAVLDDVVVDANAYTEEGREKVRTQYSLLASIASGEARVKVVGTRYHPKDLYNDMLEREIEDYDELGNIVGSTPLFEIMERQVESVGDGTGEFLWPRQQRSDGRWFGFDQAILARKRADYINRLYFRAQYYNDPHDVDSSPIQRSQFQYFEPGHLHRRDGRWFYKVNPLNVFAAVDFAYSKTKKADSTSIVVVGCDGYNNYYVLDIDRFKTDKISDYYTHILKLFEKWGFRKIRAEVNAAQVIIVKDLKDNYIRRHGLGLSIDESHPTKWQGAKEERINSTLQPRYANGQIFHYNSGNTQLLEEELLYANPAHDDIKDALAAAIDLAVPPINMFRMTRENKYQDIYNTRFGGVA